MATLLHGTTRLRADRIAAEGPGPQFPGPEGFSSYLEGSPFLFDTLEALRAAWSSLRKEVRPVGCP